MLFLPQFILLDPRISLITQSRRPLHTSSVSEFPGCRILRAFQRVRFKLSHQLEAWIDDTKTRNLAKGARVRHP